MGRVPASATKKRKLQESKDAASESSSERCKSITDFFSRTSSRLHSINIVPHVNPEDNKSKTDSSSTKDDEKQATPSTPKSTVTYLLDAQIPQQNVSAQNVPTEPTVTASKERKRSLRGEPIPAVSPLNLDATGVDLDVKDVAKRLPVTKVAEVKPAAALSEEVQGKVSAFTQQYDNLLRGIEEGDSEFFSDAQYLSDVFQIPIADTTTEDVLDDPRIAKLVQGSSLPLSDLASMVHEKVPTADVSIEAIKIKIGLMAERKAYGVRERSINVFEDVNTRAMWCWELTVLDSLNRDEAALVRKTRAIRRQLGTQARCLSRMLALLAEPCVNEAKLSVEEAKLLRYERDRLAQLAKKKSQEQKLQEKEALKAVREKEKAERVQKASVSSEEERKAKSLLRWFSRNDDHEKTEVHQTDLMGRCENEASIIERIQRMDRAMRIGSSSTDVTMSWMPWKRAKPVISRQKIGSHVVKFLQFHDNYRPAYYGTWRKVCCKSRAGRRPFSKVYGMINYDVDSDAEWEEEEPGESISGTDESDLDDIGDDGLDYEDGWLAKEDNIVFQGVPGQDILNQSSEALGPWLCSPRKGANECMVQFYAVALMPFEEMDDILGKEYTPSNARAIMN